MPNLNAKNIPDDLWARLCNYASAKDLNINEAVIAAIEREVREWEFLQRGAQRVNTLNDAQGAKTMEGRLVPEIDLGSGSMQ